MRARVATALVNKGIKLAGLGRLEEAARVFGEVVARLGDGAEPGLREQVATALIYKGVTLGGLRHREQVISALYNKDVMPGQLGRPEDEIRCYDEVVARFGDAAEPGLRTLVAAALINKGNTLGQLGRPEDEIRCCDEVVARLGDAAEPGLREQVATALVNKGSTLVELGRPEEAARVCDEVVARFRDAAEPGLREQVAAALRMSARTKNSPRDYSELKPTSGKILAWDLFISHASEDKETLVRPLATELGRLGLRVWYDEFSLRLGDSISASIDRGLAESESGLVVISPSFMAKPWPQRELAGLVAGEIGRKQVIVPVWLNVSRDEVLTFSPPLADKAAIIASDVDLPGLALRILERVKPELHQAFHRREAYFQIRREAPEALIDARFAEPGPIRHMAFPLPIANRLRLVYEVLREVNPMGWRQTIDNFRRDLNPKDELNLWEFVASIYQTVVNEFQLTLAERKQLFIRIFIKFCASGIEPWQLSAESPEWEHRAFELASLSIDQLDDNFASRGRPSGTDIVEADQNHRQGHL